MRSLFISLKEIVFTLTLALSQREREWLEPRLLPLGEGWDEGSASHQHLALGINGGTYIFRNIAQQHFIMRFA